jgi:cytochrome c oxidase cbb3-type subunit I/II
MPTYPWLFTQAYDASVLPAKLKVQRLLGVPYGPLSAAQIFDQVDTQAKVIAKDLRTAGGYVAPDREIVALIAYLQTLGKSVPVPPKPAALP